MEPWGLYYGTEQMKNAVPEETTIFGINIHIIANIIIVLIGIVIWVGNRKKIAEYDANPEWEYCELLYKLKQIIGGSERDIFFHAAKEKGRDMIPEYRVKEDFKKYLQSDAQWVPQYVKEFLDDGRETIMETKVNRWVI
jgi:hypothetical protein